LLVQLSFDTFNNDLTKIGNIMKLFSLILILSLVLISCSSKSDKELFADAAKYLEEEKILESVEAYNKVIEDFPESELAPQAMTQLAGIYHGKKVQTLSESESLLKADSIFNSIYLTYPESDEAPLGLFMSGFIQANELEDFQRATVTYNTFLEKYPNHELAVSAKEELENMGLSPEEILKRNLSKQE
jgi:outer membrane protein assembly factor BamD (BamD/ComL family)